MVQLYLDDQFDSLQELLKNSRGPGYFVTLDGAYHYDFTDLSLISPLTKMLGLTGPISPERAHQIVRAYTLAFFDASLKMKENALLQADSAYFPEVRVRSYRTAAH